MMIDVTSVAGNSNQSENITTGIGQGSYSYQPTKAAGNHLTRTLAVTLAKRNICVNAIAPGVYLTNMTSYGYSVHKGMDLKSLLLSITKQSLTTYPF